MDMKKRTYTMRARAESSAATRARLIQAALDEFGQQRSFGITLAAVTRRSGITTKTALRHFGSREALLDAAVEQIKRNVTARRTAPPGDVDGALRLLICDYELIGDNVLGTLAEEDRDPRAKALSDAGRAGHRDWGRQVFARELATTADDQREEVLDLFVMATDVYTWKLFRRDRNLTQQQVHERMTRAVTAFSHDLGGTSNEERQKGRVR